MNLERLKIQILVENVSGPGGTLGESGFSALVKAQNSDSELNILFDTGPSPVAFLNNVKKLDVDLTTIDAIVLSHGHWDHVGGLKETIALTNKHIPVICHPQALLPKILIVEGKQYDIGIQGFFESIEDLKKQVNLITKTTPYELTDSIITTGEVPRRNNYEVLTGRIKDVTTVENGKIIPDELKDDLSLIFHLADDSVVILAGCCHAGIVNTITKSIELTGSKKIIGVIGGLHLHDASYERLSWTVHELKEYPMKIMAPCHCTGIRGKCALLNGFGRKFLDITVSSKVKFEATN